MSKAKNKEKPVKKTKQAAAAESAPPKKTEIKITAAKGRPMLTWVGKRPLSHVTAFPAQHVESFAPSYNHPPFQGEGWGGDGVERERGEGAIWKDWPSSYPKGGLLFHGDNKEVLAHLLANGFRGKVNLICLDPPFDSGADYVRKVSLRGAKGTTTIAGETYTLGEQIQYTDIWANDNYLQFMYERLMLLKELLSNDGSLYLHCDTHRTHHLRCLLEEVFGPENIRNEIIWQRFNFRADGNKYGTVHDTIYLATKSDVYQFDKPYVHLKSSYIKSHFKPDEKGRLYRLDNLTAPSHGKQGKALKFGDKVIAPPAGAMWRFAQGGIDDLWAKNLIEIPEDGVPQVKRYLDEIEGQAVHSIWTDVRSINSQSHERTDYNTQKPEEMVARLVEASSKAGDIVLDCFMGSGTTAAVAQKLGRRWIGCDINNGAVQLTSTRLQTIIQEQIEESKIGTLSLDLSTEEDKSKTQPAQSAFSIWCVNDYDLAIQHNEAVNLACEHIGIERMRTDAYFDGTYRKSLVKIIPFGHPLTPLDLEELRLELEARPDEDRPFTVVCLGMELAAKAWVEDWNRLRKGKDAVNKIEVIELRTDPKYGKFMQHESAKAKIKISRKKDTISVEIGDFISPTIIERLSQQAGLLKPKIDDWRAMVDCVMIDTAYDGKVFNVALSDVPEKKTDYVQGSYELPAPDGDTTVAVKIIDMLGEEVLVIKSV